MPTVRSSPVAGSGASADSSSRVQWVTKLEEFENIAAEWDRLTAAPHPFLLYDWLSSWLLAFAEPADLRLAVTRRGGRLVGGLPLVSSGAGVAAMANDHSPVYGVAGRDPAATRAVLRSAVTVGGMLMLPSVPRSDTPLMRGGRHWWTLLSEGPASPIVECTGPFAAWREASRPKWGSPIERFRRKLMREHDVDMTLVERPDDLAATLDAGFALEASGWKGQAGTAILSDRSVEAFYRSVAEAFHRRGELRVSQIVMDGRVVAFDLCILYANRLFLLKTAYEEATRSLAPGLVLRLSVIERCFEAGLAAHELLGDRAGWKAKFATSERAHVTWRGYAPTPDATARFVLRRGRRAMGLVRRRVRAVGPR